MKRTRMTHLHARLAVGGLPLLCALLRIGGRGLRLPLLLHLLRLLAHLDGQGGMMQYTPNLQ